MSGLAKVNPRSKLRPTLFLPALDAFRMGKCSRLGYVGGNIAREFLFSGPHSLFSCVHRNKHQGAPNSESTP